MNNNFKIKELVNQAYNGTELSLCHWDFLTDNISVISEQFIIDFLPHFDWEKIDYNTFGWNRLVRILFIGMPYIEYLDEAEYIMCKRSLENDIFLHYFYKIPQNVRNDIVNALWVRLEENGAPIFFEDRSPLRYKDLLQSHHNDFVLYKKVFLALLSQDNGEETDKLAALLILAARGKFQLEFKNVCEGLNNLNFTKKRLWTVYKKYIVHENKWAIFSNFTTFYEWLKDHGFRG